MTTWRKQHEKSYTFKEQDFFTNLGAYNNTKYNSGIVVYDSFVMLEGLYYSDGVHSCNLYSE